MLGLNYAHIELNREIPLYVAGARILPESCNLTPQKRLC